MNSYQVNELNKCDIKKNVLAILSSIVLSHDDLTTKLSSRDFFLLSFAIVQVGCAMLFTYRFFVLSSL